MDNVDATEPLWPLAGPTGPIGGHWNDADMLEIGNVGLTLLEMKSQLSLWAFMNSPLLTSFDLRKIVLPDMATTRDLLTTSGVLDLNQDPLGYAGRRLSPSALAQRTAPSSMEVAPCDGSGQQEFVINGTDGTIIQASSGLAVTILDCKVQPPGTVGKGTVVVLEPLDRDGGKCNGTNQRWRVNGNGTITSQLSEGICLDVFAHKNPVQAHFCVANPSGAAGPPESEAWRVQYTPDNTTSIIRWGLPQYTECLQGPGANPPSSGGEVWEKQLANGNVGLLLLNRADVGSTPVNVSVNLDQIPGIRKGANVQVTNVWTGAAEGEATGQVSRLVPPHDVVLLRLAAD